VRNSSYSCSHHHEAASRPSAVHEARRIGLHDTAIPAANAALGASPRRRSISSAANVCYDTLRQYHKHSSNSTGHNEVFRSTNSRIYSNRIAHHAFS
jgi:hypothetical protein